MGKEEIQKESLNRAITGQSMANYPAIIAGFIEKGIPEKEILPRENIFTYNAWLAVGRQVKKGEHGVKVLTWVEMKGKEKDKKTGKESVKVSRRPKGTTVFHVSQTEKKEEE